MTGVNGNGSPRRARLDDAANVAVLALIALVAVPIRYRIPGPFGSISTFDLFLLPLSAVEWQRPTRLRRPPMLPVLVLACFLGWVVASGLWTVDHRVWARGLVVFLESAIAGATVYHWAIRVGPRRVWGVWCWLGVFAAIAAIIWFVGLHRANWLDLQPPITADEVLSQSVRLGSPFWGPSSYFASLMLLFVPLAFGLQFVTSLGRVALGLLGTGALLATLSRGGLVGAFAAGIVLLFSRRPVRIGGGWQRLLIMVGVGLLAVMVGAAALWLRAKLPYQGSLFQDPTRTRYWTEAWSLFLQQPIWGHGYGSWDRLVNGSDRTGVHDYYLQAAVELGIVGVVLFGLFLATLVRTAFGLSRYARPAVLAVLAAVVFNIAFEASFEGVVFGWLFGMFLGIAFASSEPRSRPSRAA